MIVMLVNGWTSSPKWWRRGRWLRGYLVFLRPWKHLVAVCQNLGGFQCQRHVLARPRTDHKYVRSWSPVSKSIMESSLQCYWFAISAVALCLSERERERKREEKKKKKKKKKRSPSSPCMTPYWGVRNGLKFHMYITVVAVIVVSLNHFPCIRPWFVPIKTPKDLMKCCCSEESVVALPHSSCGHLNDPATFNQVLSSSTSLYHRLHNTRHVDGTCRSRRWAK